MTKRKSGIMVPFNVAFALSVELTKFHREICRPSI